MNEEIYPLYLTVLSTKQPQPKKWRLTPIKISRSILPETLSSDSQLKYSDWSLLNYSRLPEERLKVLRKRRVLPYFGFGYRHAIERVYLRRDTYSRRSLLQRFNRNISPIFKEAKNLKSLYVDPECELANFKCIKNARGLQDLSLKVHTRQILESPEALKGLNSLQKVELFLRWSGHDDNESIKIGQFFELLLNLPKLQHVNIWLDEGGDYYKSLLSAIHQRKLPSFHIIVTNTSTLSESSESLIDWGNFIDSLSFCPIYPLESAIYPRNVWHPAQRPEKRLRLQHGLNIDDLIDRNTTIKNIGIEGLSCFHSVDYCQKILKLISQTVKQLEKLFLRLEMISANQIDFINAFNQQFSQIESFENLQTFYFHLKEQHYWICHSALRWINSKPKESTSEEFAKISPPYSSKMKNVKTLYLTLEGRYFNLADFTEALKGLVSLESFYFHLVCPNENRDEKVECKLPLGWLQNLKLIRVYSRNPFFESSVDQFIGGACKLKKLQSFEMIGNILIDLDKEKIHVLVKGLFENKSLEIVTLGWRRCQDFGWKKINGEWALNPDYLPVR